MSKVVLPASLLLIAIVYGSSVFASPTSKYEAIELEPAIIDDYTQLSGDDSMLKNSPEEEIPRFKRRFTLGMPNLLYLYKRPIPLSELINKRRSGKMRNFLQVVNLNFKLKVHRFHQSFTWTIQADDMSTIKIKDQNRLCIPLIYILNIFRFIGLLEISHSNQKFRACSRNCLVEETINCNGRDY